MEDKVYKQDARQLVDMLFDSKFFRADLLRKDMRAIEDYIKFCLQSKFEGYKKAQALIDSLKDD